MKSVKYLLEFTIEIEKIYIWIIISDTNPVIYVTNWILY
jgi:hypothetical protein